MYWDDAIAVAREVFPDISDAQRTELLWYCPEYRPLDHFGNPDQLRIELQELRNRLDKVEASKPLAPIIDTTMRIHSLYAHDDSNVGVFIPLGIDGDTLLDSGMDYRVVITPVKRVESETVIVLKDS